MRYKKYNQIIYLLFQLTLDFFEIRKGLRKGGYERQYIKNLICEKYT